MRSLIAILAAAFIGLAFTPTTASARMGGFGGMRDHDGMLSFMPRLPQALARLTFHRSFRGRKLRADVGHDEATYSLLAGPALEIVHHGKALTVPAREPVTAPIPKAPQREPVRQPHGRAPAPRRRQG